MHFSKKHGFLTNNKVLQQIMFILKPYGEMNNRGERVVLTVTTQTRDRRWDEGLSRRWVEHLTTTATRRRWCLPRALLTLHYATTPMFSLYKENVQHYSPMFTKIYEMSIIEITSRVMISTILNWNVWLPMSALNIYDTKYPGLCLKLY